MPQLQHPLKETLSLATLEWLWCLEKNRYEFTALPLNSNKMSPWFSNVYRSTCIYSYICEVSHHILVCDEHVFLEDTENQKAKTTNMPLLKACTSKRKDNFPASLMTSRILWLTSRMLWSMENKLALAATCTGAKAPNYLTEWPYMAPTRQGGSILQQAVLKSISEASISPV